MHNWCPRSVISAWKLRKKWTCAGWRMSIRMRIRSGALAGLGPLGTPGHGEDAGTPARPGELTQVGNREQQREHRGVGQFPSLVGTGDQVGDVVGERLQHPVCEVAGHDLESGVAQLARQLVSMVSGADVARYVKVDPPPE